MGFEGAIVDTAELELLNKIQNAISGNQKTSRYLKYGVLRRFLDINSAVRMLQEELPPGIVLKYRDDYDIDGYALMSLLVNSIYMNIAGLLDNVAWFLVEYSAKQVSNNSDVGLFNKHYWKQIGLEDLKKEIFVYNGWHREFKNIRDPIAHRIPLYVPMIIDNGNKSTGYPLVAVYFEEGKFWDLYKELRDDWSYTKKILNITLDYLDSA